MALLTLAAMAQSAETHLLRVKMLPEGAISVNFYLNGSRYENKTDPVIEAQVPTGYKLSIYHSGQYGSYVLKQVTENGQIVDVETSGNYFYYTMPDKDVELVGLFEFDPKAPTYQPGAGSWDPETGTLICDNGTYSSSTYNIPGFNYSEDKDKVVTYILGNTTGGYSEQLSLYSDFPNCVTLDLSRTTIKQLYISGERPALKEVILPSTFTSFGQNAMKAVQLQTLICYALTPPELYGRTSYDWSTGERTYLEQQVFFNCPDMVVRVPAESVPLYQAANGWKDFTIVPMDQAYANLSVYFMASPNNEILKLYKDMMLQLTDLSTEQVRSLLVNGRNNYEFRYLPQNTNYSLSLQDGRGSEAAHIDNIFVGEQNQQVTMGELKLPRHITLTLTADGKAADEEDFTTTWLTPSGNYLTRGTVLDNVFDGQQILCLTTLGNNLAKDYQQPDTLAITISAPYDITLPLEPLRTATATFTVVDSLTHQGIDKAVIQVMHQLPGGETGAVTTLTTNALGIASGQVLEAPSAVIVTSPMHGSKTLHVNLAKSPNLRVSFLPANGTCVQISHTFQPAVDEGMTAQVEPVYIEGRSLEYTFTATLPNGTEKAITEYLTNYPLYTFYDDLPQGTRLRVGVSSAKDDLEPVEAEAVVGSDKTVSVLLPLVERGSIVAKYLSTESKKPALLVIDGQTGEVVRRMAFDTEVKAITINSLPHGNYLVAAMSQGMQYSGITTKAQLEQYKEDADYLCEEVSISDGHNVSVSFGTVPLCTTQLETNLTQRRAQFTAIQSTIGYYAGINVKVQFKDITTKAYDGYGDPNLPTDCKLEVYVPKGLGQPTAYRSYRQYIRHNNGPRSSISSTNYATVEDAYGNIGYSPGSILTKKADSQWNEAEHKLTIDWPNVNEGGEMKLSMLPTLAGSFHPEIYLTYTLHGKKMREMLETDELTVTRSGIKVPETIIKPSFVATGTAMYFDETETTATENDRAQGPRKAASAAVAKRDDVPKFYEVTVMDGEQPIGKGNINASGEWKVQCTLPQPYALSKHNIYAKIAYKNGISYQTEAKTVTYDPYAIVPLSVRMSFFNHHPAHLVNTEINFNFETGSASPSAYGFDNIEEHNTDFTFEINLSNNDTTKVYACDLIIFTKGPEAEEIIVPAHYNTRKNRWIAYEKFNTQSLPYTVDVKPYYHHDIYGSHQEIKDIISSYEETFKLSPEVIQLQKSIDQKLELMQQQINAGNGDAAMATGDEVLALLTQMARMNGLTMELADVTEADEATMMPAIDELINQQTYFEGAMGENAIQLRDIGTMVEGVIVGPATGMTEMSLLAAGYEALLLDDGTKLFVRAQADNSLSVVSLSENLAYTYSPSAANAARRIARLSWSDIQEKISEFNEKLSSLNDYVGQLSNWADVVLQAVKVYVTKLGNEHSKILKWYQITKNTTKLNALEKAALNITRLTKLAAINAKTTLASKIGSFFSHFKLGDGLGTISGLISLVNDYMTFNKQIDHLVRLNNGLPSPCTDDQARCDQLSNDIMSFTNYSLVYNTAKIAGDLLSVAGAVASLAGCATLAAAPEGVVGLACSLGLMGLNYAGGKIYDAMFTEQWNDFIHEKAQLQCHKSKSGGGDNNKKDCKRDCGGGGGGGNSDPTLDPSGFVYEGVESNRLEGVTATVFYKEIGKNQFGDDVEKVMIWDAERYAQENPQITDENGEYGWMVPAGLWQVKYEKQGYQTEYSEWLPVPPPQLDVNQPMIQYSEPQVSGVKATPQMVQVNFDKYMLADSLNTKTILVSQGGKKVDGSIDTMTDSEQPTAQPLTDKVRFVPAAPLSAEQTYTLTVKRNVTSYAGIQMYEDYSKNINIKTGIEQLVADSVVHVIYDQPTEVTIQALPAEAAAGKKVNVEVLSDMIASANVRKATFNSEGKAVIKITGEANGTTAVLLQMVDDSDIETTIVVKVRDEDGFICPMPEANYVDGIELTYGALITLSCEVPEAVIYYTLDGTCPCDSKSAMRYEGPIALTGPMTLKAYAVAPGYADSDIAEYNFFLNAITETTINNEPVIVMKGVYDLQGRKLSDDTNVKMKKGIYIINGEKVVVR
jgi:hypothetical protein